MLWLFASSLEIAEMELSGALSNPRLHVELRKLSRDGTSCRRPVRPLLPAQVKGRRTPILATVVRVLEQEDERQLSLREIHAACERFLATRVSYRALKSGLAEHQRSRQPSVIRTRRGYYQLAT